MTCLLLSACGGAADQPGLAAGQQQWSLWCESAHRIAGAQWQVDFSLEQSVLRVNAEKSLGAAVTVKSRPGAVGAMQGQVEWLLVAPRSVGGYQILLTVIERKLGQSLPEIKSGLCADPRGNLIPCTFTWKQG